MMPFFGKNKKEFLVGFSAFLLGVFLFTQVGLFVALPKKAEASVPINCSEIDFNCIKEAALDLAVRELARELFDEMINLIIDWVTGNRGENVGYVRNLEEILRRVLDRRGREFLGNLSIAGLNPDLQQFLESILRRPVSLRDALTAEAGGVNYTNAYTGQPIGWVDFLRVTVNARGGDPYGAYFIALDEKLAEEEAIARATQESLQANRGFRGVLQEVVRRDVEDSWTEYEAVTPGGLVADVLSGVALSDFDWVADTDELSELLVELARLLINTLVTENLFPRF